ncbi:MAG: DAK2 domain-containing protein, partial [Clostridiales bacterium]|nr:DAK2 domain-containing protein [Clostridiales bacterium]
MAHINGTVLKRMILNASAAVENNKQKINELNVFPVPDGDTGTNMFLTLSAAVRELSGVTSDNAGEVADTVGKAMVRGARGNSGVILSLLFRGFAKHIKDMSEIDGAVFAAAMRNGVDTAYKAIMKPSEGTILTVSRVSSEQALLAAEKDHDPEHVLNEMLISAKSALSETVNQNPVLQKANVIDAGGMGFCVILDAMLRALRGEDIASSSGSVGGTLSAADFSEFSSEDIKYAYCTEFIVNIDKKNKSSNAASYDKLRAVLDSIGDSLVFVEDEDVIKIHVHTNSPGKALEEGLKYGYLTSIKIENMREQHTEKVIITGKDPVRPGERVIAKPEKKYGIVVVCSGNGISAVFRDIGADQIVEGGQTMNPSTEDILRAIDATPAEIVLVFPNNKNIIMAAEQCIAMSEKTVVVIPTRTVPQGITALLNFDPDLEISQNREIMLDAVSKVRTGQVTYASRDSLFDGKRIKQGEYLGIIDGELITNNKLL